MEYKAPLYPHDLLQLEPAGINSLPAGSILDGLVGALEGKKVYYQHTIDGGFDAMIAAPYGAVIPLPRYSRDIEPAIDLARKYNMDLSFHNGAWNVGIYLDVRVTSTNLPHAIAIAVVNYHHIQQQLDRSSSPVEEGHGRQIDVYA